jgi:hypothetical protein
MQQTALHRAETTGFKIPDATDNKAGCNGQHCNVQQAENDIMQRSALHHAEKTGFPIPDATDNKIGCNGQHCNVQQAEPTTCNVATCCLNLHFNLQHAT